MQRCAAQPHLILMAQARLPCCFVLLPLTSVILRYLPLSLSPRLKKKRFWPTRSTGAPVLVASSVGGEGPGPTTDLSSSTSSWQQAEKGVHQRACCNWACWVLH